MSAAAEKLVDQRIEAARTVLFLHVQDGVLQVAVAHIDQPDSEAVSSDPPIVPAGSASGDPPAERAYTDKALGIP